MPRGLLLVLVDGAWDSHALLTHFYDSSLGQDGLVVLVRLHHDGLLLLWNLLLQSELRLCLRSVLLVDRGDASRLWDAGCLALFKEVVEWCCHSAKLLL